MRLFVCPGCGRRFDSKQAFRAHTRAHPGCEQARKAAVATTVTVWTDDEMFTRGWTDVP